MSSPISAENAGLRNLQALVNSIRGQPANKSVPIVLVSGFSAWGEALFGTFNYWGGFENLPEVLNKLGYLVIAVRIGPFSSDWERACEVYAQLTAGKLDSPTDPATPLDVDYGSYYPERYDYVPRPGTSHKTKRAVGYHPSLKEWKWSAANPVHFIAHSQGGNTVRFLIELMSGRLSFNEDYFPPTNRQNWIKSLVTLGTPHKGTTIIDIVKGILPPNENDVMVLLTRLITSVSFQEPRFYDLQLDHRGFTRGERVVMDSQNRPVITPETFPEMSAQLLPLVIKWWSGNGDVPHNGFYDNSIEGVQALKELAPNPSPDIFYFTMSFDATRTFPNETLTADDLASLPLPIPSSTITDSIVHFFSRLGSGVIWAGSRLPGFPSIVALAQWFVKLLNRHLGDQRYFNRIPIPGRYVPRPDVLPLLLVTAVGMGGFEGRTPPGISAKEYQPNDGVVNTLSMKGPSDEDIEASSRFPNRSSGGGGPGGRGTYWHLGVNKTMDHADEIGVFTVGETYDEVKLMYELFAELLTKLS